MRSISRQSRSHRWLRNRATALALALALAVMNISALAHALTHEFGAPDTSCATCLASHHLGKTLVSDIPTTPLTPAAAASFLPPDTGIIGLTIRGYFSRAPPAPHAN